MVSVQYTCAKIGMITGSGLATVVRKNYPRLVLYPIVFALVIANSLNAGADISAIAAAVNMLVPISASWLIVPLSCAILAMQMFGSYKLIVSIFKWLSLALLAYVATAFFIKLDAKSLLHSTFTPSVTLNGHFLAMLLAILGTTLSPYLFFWQTDQEVEEKISDGKTRLWQRRGASQSQLRNRLWDVNAGMLYTSIVMYFIIVVTGATLFGHGQHDITTATQAAMALRPFAGDAACLLFALGIIGSGFLAVPILTTSGAYALSQIYGWNHGLDHKWNQAKEFYAVIALSTVFGMIIPLTGINPIGALYWVAVINGVLAAPLLLVIMLIANNKRVMGGHTNGRLANALGWTATVLIFLAGLGTFFTIGT